MAPARQQQHYTPTHALACPHQGRSRLDSEQQRGSPLGGYFLTAVSDQSCSEYPYISRPRPCCAFGGSCAFDAVFYQPAVAVFANLLLERVVGNTEPHPLLPRPCVPGVHHPLSSSSSSTFSLGVKQTCIIIPWSPGLIILPHILTHMRAQDICPAARSRRIIPTRTDAVSFPLTTPVLSR